MKFKLIFIGCYFLLVTPLCKAQKNIDNEAILKIKSEELNHSQIKNIAFNLIDKSGPRLTNSIGFENAANYVIKQFSEWGLVNINKEPWGEFGRGWQLEKSYIAMTKPYYMSLIAIPKAWTDGTNGNVKGKVVVIDINTEEDFSKYKGKLKGAIALLKYDGDLTSDFKADATRFTKKELKEGEKPRPKKRKYTDEEIAVFKTKKELNKQIRTFLYNEGAVLLIKGVKGKEGTVFTSSPIGYEKDTPKGICEVEMAPEHANLMYRLIMNGVDVEVEAEIKTKFKTDNLQAYNIVAEISGTDEKLKPQVVMLGAHLDSWHGATGATDNGAGCVVMMEAVRLLIATHLKPKRTIRLALWSGEEQGLLGSWEYAKKHFGDAYTMKLKEAQKNISAYYNIDNGTGRIRGVFLEGNEKLKPIFKQWFADLKDIVGNATLSLRGTSGTDHKSFDVLDIPAFQFIQDPIAYHTRTHHSNMDTYERLMIDDLKQMAIVIATFVYNTTQRDEILPRKPLKQ